MDNVKFIVVLLNISRQILGVRNYRERCRMKFHC